MKIEEGYSESNVTKSERFAAKIWESEQNMEFLDTLIHNRISSSSFFCE